MLVDEYDLIIRAGAGVIVQTSARLHDIGTLWQRSALAINPGSLMRGGPRGLT